VPTFRYRKPGYVAINVSDLERSIAYYRDLVGLELEQVGQDMAFLRCSDDHHNLVLCQGGVPGIKRMAFEMESDADLDAIEAHLAAMGCPVDVVSARECEILHQGRTVRTKLPACSLTFEFYARMERAPAPYRPTVARIQRLGHVVVGLKERDAVLKALVEQLNFRVSDYFGEQVVFLRCFPNPFHHSFGLSRATHDHLHHVNFMVSDIDDVGKAMNRMLNNHVEVVYGPGRHDISTSIFIYFLDPDGMTTEYSFGMEEFAEDAPREPRQLPMRPEILDSWGGMPKEGFGKIGVVEA